MGAAVLGSDGRIYAGANVENASYGLSVCAERVAVFRAVAAGARRVVAAAVVAATAEPPTPCGACRQVLAEFAPDLNLPIVLVTWSGRIERTTLGDLFPRPFKFLVPGLMD